METTILINRPKKYLFPKHFNGVFYFDDNEVKKNKIMRIFWFQESSRIVVKKS